MSTISSKPELKKNGILITFLIFCSLCISENSFSQKHWNRDYMKLSYDTLKKAVSITFEFFDYDSGPALVKGYLESCNFEFSIDSVNYTHLMTASTCATWTCLCMSNKLTGTVLQFLGCDNPPSGTFWQDTTSVRVFVNNEPKTQDWLTIKWFLGSNNQKTDEMFIRINGKWAITGLQPDSINNEIYKVATPFGIQLKSEIKTDTIQKYVKDQPYLNAVKVNSEADAIVIKGAELGENIQVYTTTGAQIKSIVTNNDVVKIKLPANQIYLINIGQSRYKVAL